MHETSAFAGAGTVYKLALILNALTIE